MRRYNNPPTLDDVQYWEDAHDTLIQALVNPDIEEREEDIQRSIREQENIRFIKSELMRLFPKYDCRLDKKPEIIPSDCYWWNGVEKFIIDSISNEKAIVKATSYVGGDTYDSRLVSIVLPHEIV